MKVCPKCGSTTFYVRAHVVQEWLVDSDGDYLETITECTETTHFPKDDDIWDCSECHYSDVGYKFNKEEK